MLANNIRKGLTDFDWALVEADLPDLLKRALAEDVGDGDVTSMCTIPPDLIYEGALMAKQAGVVAGLEVARRTFHQVDPQIQVAARINDGTYVESGERFAAVIGPARSLLTAERVVLNFMQRMSGIATMTARYVQAVGEHRAQILDTRKTAPGLRLLDKWAVALGGGTNHRIGLYDMVLIKDNHIIAAGGISAAVDSMRNLDSRKRPIEVEVKNLTELREALDLHVDQIMLDNMSVDDMRSAVELANGRVPLEASGNVSLETVPAIAATGVDYISVGKLTHSVAALDISFDLSEQ